MKVIERIVIFLFSFFAIYCATEFLDRTFASHSWVRLDASAWASWVQAVGSIAALVIAIYVMSKQNAHAVRLVVDADRIATLRMANAVRAILKRYYAQLLLANDSIQKYHTKIPYVTKEDGLQLQAAYQSLKRIPANLQAIPIFEIGSFDLATAVLAFTEIATECINGLHAMNTPSPNLSSDAATQFRRLVVAADRTLREYENAVIELERERAPPIS
jgi:hypothetical protein